jgi:light-regulated signal transduction histidine kinase (bacteriophytochrome)
MAQTIFQVSTDELENCAREQIHLTPLVQSFGFLLACEAASGRIVFVSANVDEHIGYRAQEVLGQPLMHYLQENAIEVLAKLAALMPGSPQSVDLTLRKEIGKVHHYEWIGHRSGELVLLEAMSFGETPDEFDDRQHMEAIVAGLGRLQLRKELTEFHQQCAVEIRSISGYQRVIIYRFLPDWSGEVLAESVAPGLEQRFIGLRFPASDIPSQARALYRTNLLQIIGDVDANPIAVESLGMVFKTPVKPGLRDRGLVGTMAS